MTTHCSTTFHRPSRSGLLAVILGLVSVLGCDASSRNEDVPTPGESVALPVYDPQANAFDALLAKRSSRREFADKPLDLDVIGALCWAGQGLNDHDSRTAPSAGALYPITLYVVQASGTSRYVVDDHALQPWLEDDRRAALQTAALKQSAVGSAAVCIVVTFDESVTAAKYGSDAEKYCWIEVGHVAQNILLKVTDLGLDGVPIGGFYDDQVAVALHLPKNHAPAYILAIGKPPE